MNSDRAKPWKIIHRKREFGQDEFHFASCEEAIAWWRQNPPGPLVEEIYFYNFTHWNVSTPIPGRTGNAAFIVCGGMTHVFRNPHYDPQAYREAVEEKEWEELYYRKTGKEWQHSEEPDREKQSSVNESGDNSLDRETCLKMFELQPGFTKKNLREAYLRAVKMNHPDKVASLAEDFKQLAERKTKRINQAYELLDGSLK